MKQLPSPQKKEKEKVITHGTMLVIAKLTTLIHFRAFKIIFYPDNSLCILTSQPLQAVSLPTAIPTGEHVYAASHITTPGQQTRDREGGGGRQKKTPTTIPKSTHNIALPSTQEFPHITP